MKLKRSRLKTKMSKKMKTYSNIFLYALALVCCAQALFAANTFNEEGEFSVFVENQSASVFNDNIDTSFAFAITNDQGIQDFEIFNQQRSGWSIEVQETQFSLGPGQSKTVQVELRANSDFDYSPSVVSPDIVVISQKEDYIGYFEFPFTIVGENENISLRYSVSIEPREILPVEFEPRISNTPLSPANPLQYTVTASNVVDPVTVQIRTFIGDELLSSEDQLFTSDESYKIFSYEIPATLVPGQYGTEVVVRLAQSGTSAQEWFATSEMTVENYENLVVGDSVSKNFLKDTYKIEVQNRGNVKSTFEEELPVNPFTRIFFSSNVPYEIEDGMAKISLELDRGQSATVKYGFNYIALYVIIIVALIVLIYVYMRRASNPLDVETKIYEVKKVQHEGIKSMKVRIGFENIKAEEIETLRVVFRMPTYLQVKDDSFLLSPPKKVLKGATQYKLVWEFKRFGRNDSRILGFALVNKKGILGDLRLPALEVEVKMNGKVRKYYEAFPTVR